MTLTWRYHIKWKRSTFSYVCKNINFIDLTDEVTYTMWGPKNKRCVSQNSAHHDRAEEWRHPGRWINCTILEWPLVC